MMRVDQKILHRLEQQGTKAPAIRIGAFEEMALKHHNEKILREILGIRDGSPAPADESENRPPISLAEVLQRLSRLLLIAPRVGAGDDYAPPRGGELIRAGLPIASRFNVHERGAYLFTQLLGKLKRTGPRSA